MNADDSRLTRLAAAAAEGVAIDWSREESATRDPEELAIVRQLRAVAQMADAVQTLGDGIEPLSLVTDASGGAGPADGPETGESAPSPEQARWGAFVLQGEIGKGTFGTVYRAWEPNLARTVALKLLHVVKPGSEERVIAEARLLAHMSHENIVTVHGADRFDGRVGFWMEFVDGRTLKEMHERNGRFSAPEAIIAGLDLCRALAAVHRSGYLHCDVKAQNAMRADGGRIVLMDFGGARLRSVGVNEAPGLTGTPLYLAPELLLGGSPSVQSDLYSLGVLLYYLVTGAYPVAGRSVDDVRAAHASQRRTWLRDARPDLPAPFVRAVDTATAILPGERPDSAGVLEAMLEAAAGRVSAPRPRPSPQRFGAEPSVAVLRFADRTPDKRLDYFCEGLAEEIFDALGKIPALRVVSRASGGAADDDGRRVGESLDVGAVLQGGVQASGDRLRVIARLVDASTGVQLWSERFDRDAADLFGVQDEIAQAAVRELGVRVKGEPGRAVRPRHPAAYTLYLKGRHCWNQRTEAALHRSVEYFQSAIASDPDYADAQAGLAEAYATLGLYGGAAPNDVMPLARKAAGRALDLAPHLCSPHATVGCVEAIYDWSWHEAARHFHHAIDLNPGHPAAHHWYAINYLVPLRRFAEATVELHRALDADPLSMPIRASLGLRSYFAHEFDRAARELRETLELDPTSGTARLFLGLTLAETEQYDEALTELEIARGVTASPEVLAALGYVLARAGRPEAANGHLEALMTMTQERYVSPSLVAQVNAGLGETDEALEWLETAAFARAADLAWLAVRPVFDSLRSEPRFNALVVQLGA